MDYVVPSEVVSDALNAAVKKQHGDGKIFISPVDAVFTLRTGQKVPD